MTTAQFQTEGKAILVKGHGLQPVKLLIETPETEYKGIATDGLKDGHYVEVCECHPDKTEFTFVSIEDGKYFS